MKKPTYEELELRVRELEAIVDKKEQSERALAESRQKFANMLESIDEGYFEVDLKGNFTFVNDAMCRIAECGFDKLIGMNNREYMSARTAEKVYHVFNEVYRTGNPGTIVEYEITTIINHRKVMALSTYLMRDETGIPIGFRGFVRDHTERRKTEEKLLHLQKMEAIGTLAGGIAHDFNNILFPIIGYTEMTINEVPADSIAREFLENILHSALRAKDLVGQILDFSRPGKSEVMPMRINPIFKETIKLLKASLPATIGIQSRIADNLQPILGNPTQIHQIIMNLCTNAFHAMEDMGGKLDVVLEEIQVADGEDIGILETLPGRYVRMTVRDTGKGMDQSVLTNIFEPFFTTKEKGKGTGLGLSTVYGIVSDYKGNISVQSEPGVGTTFQIYLPLAEKAETEHGAEGPQEIPTGTESILVVDDEKIIVEMEKRMLEELGYQVAARTSSIEAYEAFCHDPNKYDAVISDMTMPNMTGIQLAQKLLQIKPNLPFILLTGYDKRFSKSQALAVGIKGYLLKPVIKKNLAEALRNALDQPLALS